MSLHPDTRSAPAAVAPNLRFSHVAIVGKYNAPGSRDAVEAIGDALVGIEMVGSRFDDPDAVSFPTLLGDNHGCAGYVTGTTIEVDGGMLS